MIHLWCVVKVTESLWAYSPKLTGWQPTPALCTMSSMIHSPADIKAAKLEFLPVKILDNGGKSVNIRYEGRNLMVETPSLNVPYGVNIFDKTPGAPVKFSVDLSLRGADENEGVRALQDFLEAFDERMIDAGVENAGKWFKMSNPNREVIKAFYTPVVKISRDAAGNPKPYPPTFKLSLRKKIKKGEKPDTSAASDVGRFETEFYNAGERDGKGQVVAFEVDAGLETVLPKRSQVTAIIQCTGVWFAGGKFGTTWKAVQVRVDSQPEQIRGPAFKSDAPDIRAFVAKKLPAAAAASGGAGSGAVADDDGYGGGAADEDNDAEEEAALMAAVVPKPVAVAPVVKPDPAPAAFEDEEAVAEPIPVPKKVVKKMVTKAAAK